MDKDDICSVFNHYNFINILFCFSYFFGVVSHYCPLKTPQKEGVRHKEYGKIKLVNLAILVIRRKIEIYLVK